MKTRKILILLLLCLLFSIAPVGAQAPENTADSAEALNTAVSTLSESGGTIHITKDIILGTDSRFSGYEPYSHITLDLGDNTLYIQSSWSFKNISITGENTLISLENGANLRLSHSSLEVSSDNVTAVKITGNSTLSAETSKIEATGTNACGIDAPGSADLSLDSASVEVSGGCSTAIRTAGSVSAFFSEISAKGSGASAVTGASEVLLNTSAVSPEVESAVTADTTIALKGPAYHYTELGGAADLPDTLIYKIIDQATGNIRYSPAVPVSWNTDTIDTAKAGVYPLGYSLDTDAPVPGALAELFEQQKQQLVVINPEKPFIYYDAPVTENAGSYSLQLRLHQPIQSLGTPVLWVEKDDSGTWTAWPADKLVSSAANQYTISGLEAGHSYVLQLEARSGSLNGSSNAVRITLDKDGSATVTQSTTEHKNPDKEANKIPNSDGLDVLERESTTPAVSPTSENAATGSFENLQPESEMYLQEMGNALNTVASYLKGTDPVSQNANTGITSPKSGVTAVLPGIAALSLVLLCTVTMVLVRK